MFYIPPHHEAVKQAPQRSLKMWKTLLVSAPPSRAPSPACLAPALDLCSRWSVGGKLYQQGKLVVENQQLSGVFFFFTQQEENEMQILS